LEAAKITIVYDNTAFQKRLRADWGFSCYIEAYNRRILFDTGASGPILLDNMKKLNIDPGKIEEIIISHDHYDHTAGLSDLLQINPVKVYVPADCSFPAGAAEVIRIREPQKIHENIFSTGALDDFEQSLVINTKKGLLVVAGCSHPGVEKIFKAASQFGKPRALVGGLHGFSDFALLRDLEMVCPTHCTQYKLEINYIFPQKYIPGGAGKELFYG
jgi:7,8-dihydropterin-6-yl-methyl-4-(beta-D-ribofuranosyl)aminobenzene 5'-phosphate synthase